MRAEAARIAIHFVPIPHRFTAFFTECFRWIGYSEVAPPEVLDAFPTPDCASLSHARRNDCGCY
jgi:hypothetical protein